MEACVSMRNPIFYRIRLKLKTIINRLFVFQYPTDIRGI